MQQQQENAIHNPDSQNQSSTDQKAPRSKFGDRMLLFGAALSVCLFGGGVALAFEIYHISQAWFFFAWSSIFLPPLVEKEFRAYFRQPAFVVFFIVWMGVHGATVAAMNLHLNLVVGKALKLAELATS